MGEIDAVDDGGCSANDRRWKCLIRLTEMLSEGAFELDQLVKEVEKKKSKDNVADHDDHLVDHGILKKNKNCVAVPANEVEATGRSIGKKSGLKITFKINSVYIQEPLPWKITTKKPSGEAMETSILESEGIRTLDKNPSFNGKRRLGFEDEEEGTISDKRVKTRTEIMNIFRNSEPIILSEEVKNRILDSGGCLETLVLVIQKELYQTDVSINHGRLSIPYRKVKNQFLQSSEVDQLEANSKGILVKLVQPCLEECQMSLRNWKSNSMYALVADWNEVCRRNALRQGMTIQLWAFRRSLALCLALVQIG